MAQLLAGRLQTVKSTYTIKDRLAKLAVSSLIFHILFILLAPSSPCPHDSFSNDLPLHNRLSV